MRPRHDAEKDAFDERLDGILLRTGYYRVETHREREDIYRLRYEAYRMENAIRPCEDRRFVDDYDHCPNAMVFGVTIDGALAGSIRIHVLSRAFPKGPAADTYGDVILPGLEAGETFVDPSRFVTSPAARADARLLPFAVTRLACMAAEHFGADWMLASVRLEHAAFYRRFCSLRPMTALRPYPCLTKPLMLLGARNADIRDSVLARYPVFASTARERLALFAVSPGALSARETRSVNDNRRA